MPYKVTSEDGEEIETFSQEEAEAMVLERTQAEAERIEQEKQEEIDRLANEKLEMEEELEKLRNKEMNFERVRNKAAGKEVEVSEEIRNQIKSLEDRISEIAAQPKNDVKHEFVSRNIGEDKEQLERFNYYYDKLGSEAKSKEEVLKAAEEALQLASGGQYKPDTSSSMYTPGASANYRNQETKQTSEESKRIGDLLGVSEADRKKYGNK